MFPDGYLMKMFKGGIPREVEMQINTQPVELAKSHRLMKPLYHTAQHFLDFKGNRTVLTAVEADEAYNVVVLGPTGCGKSRLINLFYNRTVCESTASCQGFCREHMQITHGIGTIYGMKRPVNVIDSVGFCDSALSPYEVETIIKQFIKATLFHIDKVVLVCSGRLEAGQREAMRTIMQWLQYRRHAANFAIVYNKAEGLEEDEREALLAQVCELLGAKTMTVQVGNELLPSSQVMGLTENVVNVVDMQVAVGFPQDVDYSLVQESHAAILDVVFHPCNKRICVDMNTEGSTCTVL
jgi:GTP-binding protein EngB required for normal cell division